MVSLTISSILLYNEYNYPVPNMMLVIHAVPLTKCFHIPLMSSGESPLGGGRACIAWFHSRGSFWQGKEWKNFRQRSLNAEN